MYGTMAINSMTTARLVRVSILSGEKMLMLKSYVKLTVAAFYGTVKSRRLQCFWRIAAPPIPDRQSQTGRHIGQEPKVCSSGLRDDPTLIPLNLDLFNLGTFRLLGTKIVGTSLMSRWAMQPIVLLCLVLVQNTQFAMGQVTTYRILADPDVRVSNDGSDVIHRESPITASRTDPDLLITGANVESPGNADAETRIYYSRDDGARWKTASLSGPQFGGWDHAIVGAEDGLAYFATNGSSLGTDVVYRTNDGGATWQSTPVPIAPPEKGGRRGGWDRDFIGVDTTGGRYSGRLYFAAEAWRSVYVSASQDRGNTFLEPVLACPGSPANAAALPSPQTLSDGTLIVPCVHYDEKQGMNTVGTQDFGIVESTDGGATFSPFKAIARYQSERVENSADPLLGASSTPSVAVGPEGGKFGGRLYAAWISIDGTSRRLFLSYSGDRGETWSKARPIGGCLESRYPAQQVGQGYPTIAVNKDGVVGVSWYGDCDATGEHGYNVYFTASVDGGQSWLPTVRVSSVTSYPGRGANLAPLREDYGHGSLFLESPYPKHYFGGDYVTMAADAAGRFHPLWNDARDGAWQIYTSTIRVVSEHAIKEMVLGGYSGKGDSPKTCPWDDKVKLLYGDSRWDMSAKDATIFVRLENISQSVLSGTVILRIESGTSTPSVELRDPSTGRFGAATKVQFNILVERPLFPFGVTQEFPVRLRGKSLPGISGSVKYEIEGTCSGSHLTQAP